VSYHVKRETIWMMRLVTAPLRAVTSYSVGSAPEPPEKPVTGT